MENPICDMSEEENNEHESFECFIDNPIYDISIGGSIEFVDGFIEDLIYEVFREESMDFEFLGNFCMEEEHRVCSYD